MNQPSETNEPAVQAFCRKIAQECSPTQLTAAVESLSTLKVLVVGDTIFDRYSSLKVQGLTSKNRIISGRFLSEETHCGGALAVFRHVKQFTPHAKFLSLVGTEPWVDPLLRETVLPAEDLLIRDTAFTTIIKQRFVEPLSKGKELIKLFAVNFIDDHPPASAVLAQVRARLAAALSEVDVIVVADFGHGLLQADLRELLQEASPFLALNCQTNSNNHGFNIITRQYRRADAFSLDQQELMLSCGHRHIDYAAELDALRLTLAAEYAWLTRGAVETFGHHTGHASCCCPPLASEVVDAVGAGDAFFSVAALAAARRLPVSIGTFLGQLAGAQAVKIVGNATPISRSALLQTGRSLLGG